MRLRALIIAIAYFSCLSNNAQTIGENISIGKSYSDSHEYSKAISFYKTALDSLSAYEGLFDSEIESILPKYTDALLHIGAYDLVETIVSHERYSKNYILMNNRAAALGYSSKFSQAVDVLNTILDIPDITANQRGRVYQNIGFLQIELGNYASAAENLRFAIDNLDGFNSLISKSNLAVCLAHLGHYRKSIELINSVLHNLKRNYPTYIEDYIICLRKKAEIYSIFNIRNLAQNIYNQYFELEKAYIIDNLKNLSVTDRLNLWLKEKPLLSKCFLLEDYAPEFLYEVAMFRRQTSLLGMHDIKSLQSRLATKSEDIRRVLLKNEVAIEFISYTDLNDKTVYAAIILPQREKAKFVKIFDEDFIYRPEVIGANSLINAIKRDNPKDKNLLYSDTVLANIIWEPITNALPRNVSTIYFAPEGIFHFLGIENLPFDGKEKIQLHRVSSTASLPYRAETANHKGSALLVGGLNYSSLPEDSISNSFSQEAADLLRQKAGSTNIFSYLQGTRSEVDSIKSIVCKAQLTYQIGEAELKHQIPSYDLIHIATHGYSLNLGIKKRPEFAADSLAYDISLSATGLALSGANIASKYADREDGLLSAREICDLDLSNVDFVVLSACQTAQGDITDEGAAGLVRGFKNAGVKTILATLWSVDDKSTMLFMQEFYRLLYSGKNKYEAYIGAQDYLKNYEHSVPTWKFSPSTLARESEPIYQITKYIEPYYWAPFIIIDDF